MSRLRASLLILFVLTALGITAGVVAARGPTASSSTPLTQSEVGTAFTYQGSLEQDGSPADGSFDFEFRLFDALVDGALVGAIVTLGEVAVVNGLFTVELDFGPGVFNGQDLWIEVRVRTFGDGGDFTTLSPRQAITPTPYAIFAANAWSMGGNSGTLPDTDFLGTTDAQALVIRTNDIEAVRITPDGDVGIGTADPQATLDVNGDVADRGRDDYKR